MELAWDAIIAADADAEEAEEKSLIVVVRLCEEYVEVEKGAYSSSNTIRREGNHAMAVFSTIAAKEEGE